MLSFRTQNRKAKIKNAILKSIMVFLFTITVGQMVQSHDIKNASSAEQT